MYITFNSIVSHLEVWTCGRCTLENPIYEDFCNACEASRPQLQNSTFPIERPVTDTSLLHTFGSNLYNRIKNSVSNLGRTRGDDNANSTFYTNTPSPDIEPMPAPSIRTHSNQRATDSSETYKFEGLDINPNSMIIADSDDDFNREYSERERRDMESQGTSEIYSHANTASSTISDEIDQIIDNDNFDINHAYGDKDYFPGKEIRRFKRQTSQKSECLRESQECKAMKQWQQIVQICKEVCFFYVFYDEIRTNYPYDYFPLIYVFFFGPTDLISI